MSLGHTNAVRSLCVLDDESTFLSGGRDQRLLVWKLENQNDNAVKLVINTRCHQNDFIDILELKVDGHIITIVNQFLQYPSLKVFDWQRHAMALFR